ncbi:DUF2142 domain-containing protein [Nocardia jiangsuensis]|uniref:DUF2142 domain-containing protein n=1 Tax=Nocardia jiangsuensis TaxID=1691563 RepID=A0ABV8DUX5_9NOCA
MTASATGTQPTPSGDEPDPAERADSKVEPGSARPTATELTATEPADAEPGVTPNSPGLSGDKQVERPKAGRDANAGAGAGVANRIIHKLGPATTAFLILAGLFGAVFAVITPPFWGHDEITQFGRAYQVAHGGLLPQEIADTRGIAYGGDVPKSITDLMGYALTDYTTNGDEQNPMAADPSAYDRYKSAPVSAEMDQVWFTNTAAYSPVPYLPSAIGLRTAEALDLNVGTSTLVTRLAGLAAYLAITGFALWSLRAHRIQWLAFTVAVLPIAIFQAGTVTADTLTNALAFLISALLVKALFLGDGLRRPETAALLAATLALPLCKPAYILLALLIVVIPGERLGFRGVWRFTHWIFAAAGGLLFAVWMKVAAPTGDGMSLMRPEAQWGTVRPDDQLRGILTDPIAFVEVFGESISRRDQRWFTQFFGELGFAYIDVPALAILACLLAFVIGIGIGDRLRPEAATFRRTLIVALVLLANVAMIYVTLYMSFTPVDYFIIDGVQGRYFVPLAVLTFAVLLRWLPWRLALPDGTAPGRGAALTIVGATAVALTAAAVKYHVLVWG